LTTEGLQGDVVLREAVPADASALLDLKDRLDRETSFMLLEPDERTESAAEVRSALTRTSEEFNSVVLIAEAEGRAMGYVEAIGGRYRRDRLTTYVVIGVLAAASGRGIGGALLSGLETWARQAGLHRLELTVMVDNERALALYERNGFQREGTRRSCLTVNGVFVDEIYMGKLLDLTAVIDYHR
jgi:RimJ/RimL family protein N-acetyltransferase